MHHHIQELQTFKFGRVCVVSLNLCKAYLNMATFKISVLLQIMSLTFWYIERLPSSSYAGVTQF